MATMLLRLHVVSSKTNPASFYNVRAVGCVFQNRVIWPRNARKNFAWARGKKGSRETKCNRLRAEEQWRHHPKSGGARSPRGCVRRGGLEVSEACP